MSKIKNTSALQNSELPYFSADDEQIVRAYSLQCIQEYYGLRGRLANSLYDHFYNAAKEKYGDDFLTYCFGFGETESDLIGTTVLCEHPSIELTQEVTEGLSGKMPTRFQVAVLCMESLLKDKQKQETK